MTGSIWDWSLTASDNDTADADIDWREGMFPDVVNDSARMMMQRVAALLKDIGGSLRRHSHCADAHREFAVPTTADRPTRLVYRERI